MQRFRFRLERLLRVKRQQERLAELKQMEARGVWELAERGVQAALDRLTRSAEAAEARVGAAVQADMWLQQYWHLAQLRRLVDEARAVAARARRTLDEADRCRRAAATELEAVAHLKTAQWQLHRQEAARREQVQQDDMWLDRLPRSSGDAGDVNPWEVQRS